MARAQAMSEWEVGHFVLGEFQPSGAHTYVGPVDVHGLGPALSATSKAPNDPSISVPDVDIDAHERSTAAAWFENWSRAPHERRDIVIRDNRTKKWIAIGEAWIRERRVSGGAKLCIEWAKECDGPSLET